MPLEGAILTRQSHIIALQQSRADPNRLENPQILYFNGFAAIPPGGQESQAPAAAAVRGPLGGPMNTIGPKCPGQPGSSVRAIERYPHYHP